MSGFGQEEENNPTRSLGPDSGFPPRSSASRRRALRALKLAGAIGAASLVLTAGCQRQETPPENAMYVVDDARNLYFSPPCLERAAESGDLTYLSSFEVAPRSVTRGELRSLNTHRTRGVAKAAGSLVPFGHSPGNLFFGLA